MVSSFSTRLLELSNVCDPIEQKHGNEGNGDYISTISDSNVNSRRSHDGQPTSSEKSSYKRQGYYYAHTHQHHTNDAASSNKRCRQKEDLRYAAATIQQSLSDAGHHDARDMSSILQNRRERALPMGSVDMSTVKLVVTSTKFDSEMSGGEECLVVDEEEQNDIDGQSKADTNSSDVDQEEEYNDVSEMYMLSNLIQSTRQYYSFSSDDTKTTQVTASLPTTVSHVHSTNFTNNHEKSLPRSDSSEGLSSYTPLSSENDLNHDDDNGDDKKKDIDNDNRSDGQSSDMDDTSASLSTSTSEGETSSGDGVVKEDSLGCINWDGAYSTIG